MIKKLFTHSLIYSLAPQAPKIASLLLMPIITQHVTPADYGVYGIITSYLFFITALRDLGFGVVFVNTFYKYERRWPVLWRMLHGHLVIWSFFFCTADAGAAGGGCSVGGQAKLLDHCFIDNRTGRFFR